MTSSFVFYYFNKIIIKLFTVLGLPVIVTLINRDYETLLEPSMYSINLHSEPFMRPPPKQLGFAIPLTHRQTYQYLSLLNQEPRLDTHEFIQ